MEISRRGFIKRAALVGAAVAYLGPIFAFGPTSPSRGDTVKGTARNVVLIGWDSGDRDRIWEHLERDELPYLKMLIAEGGLIAIDHLDGESVTQTRPGWTQVLTGYGCDTTGVCDNDKYRQLPEGWTIYERLKDHFGSDDFAAAEVTGKWNIGPTSIFKNANERMDEFVFPNQTEHFLDDDTVANHALEWIEKYKNKRFLFFVMLGDLDVMGHLYGENSIEYHEAMLHCDALTGDIIKKLVKLGLYDDTLIYVTSDHGHSGEQGKPVHSYYKGMKYKYFHRGCPNVFLATNDPGLTRNGAYPSKNPAGTLLDIAPTILGRFGLNLSEIDPPLYGSPLVT